MMRDWKIAKVWRASSRKDAATADRWQQVAQIYLAAGERDGADRAAFVREACAGDEGLRREVSRFWAMNAARMLCSNGPPQPWPHRC